MLGVSRKRDMIGSTVALAGLFVAVSALKVEQMVPLQTDTVEGLTAAYRHHFAETELDSVSVAIGVAARGISDQVLSEVASLLALPVARESDVFRCAAEVTYPPYCELKGLRQLVQFHVSSLTTDRAVVSVSSLTEWAPGRVDGSGTQYELERRGERWVVVKALMSWAS